MNTITEHEALTNMARGLDLTIYEKHQTDGRKKRKEYFVQRGKATLSPVLPYNELNHFLMGWRQAMELTPNRKVEISVFGGVAEVTKQPEGVEVEIIDCDNLEAFGIEETEGAKRL